MKKQPKLEQIAKAKQGFTHFQGQENWPGARYAFEMLKDFSRTQETHKKIYNLFAGSLQKCYEASSNPLYAWEAYDLARMEDKEIPKWVLSYFDSCADNLFAEIVSRANKDQKYALGAPDQLASIFGFKIEPSGGGTIFKQYLKECERWNAYFLIESQKKANPEVSYQELYEKTANNLSRGHAYNEEVSAGKVERWHTEIKKRMSKNNPS